MDTCSICGATVHIACPDHPHFATNREWLEQPFKTGEHVKYSLDYLATAWGNERRAQALRGIVTTIYPGEVDVWWTDGFATRCRHHMIEHAS